MLRPKRDIVIVVVPITAIREFVAVDMIGSTTLYYAVKLLLKKLAFVEPLAIAGSILFPFVYKKMARRIAAAPRLSGASRAPLTQWSAAR